jgi:hypothetical protein
MGTWVEETKIVRHIRASRHLPLYVSFAGRADSSVPSAPTPNKWSQTKRESVSELISKRRRNGKQKTTTRRWKSKRGSFNDRERRDDGAALFGS